MSEPSEAELIRNVFSTDQGRKLLGIWEQIFNRPSHHPDQSSEHTAFMEGNRAFYTALRMTFEEETK